MVSVFIEELDQKEASAIYNMIPDSISNLLKTNITHDEFKIIADMIFDYIKKDKHANLTEKFSSKFKDEGKDECLNLGYCLTKLTINEKAMKKLLDNVSWWQTKVLEDSLLSSYFMEISTKCRRT